MAGKAISFAACLQKAAKLKRRAREEVGPTPGVRFADLGTLEVLFCSGSGVAVTVSSSASRGLYRNKICASVRPLTPRSRNWKQEHADVHI